MLVKFAGVGAVLGLAVAKSTIAGGLHFKQLAKHASLLHSPAMKQLTRRLETAWFRGQQGTATHKDEALLQWWTSGEPLGPDQIPASEEKQANECITFTRPTKNLCVYPFGLWEYAVMMVPGQLLLIFGAEFLEVLVVHAATVAVLYSGAIWQASRFHSLEMSQTEICVLTRVSPGYDSWVYKRDGVILPKNAWLLDTFEPTFYPRRRQ